MMHHAAPPDPGMGDGSNRMSRQTVSLRSVRWLLLLSALVSCSPSAILGVDAKFYTLVAANGQPVSIGQEQQVLVGTLPYLDTTCDLLVRAGRLFTNGSDNRYDATIGMDIRCRDGGVGLAHASEHGTFKLSGGTFSFQPITVEGLRLTAGTKSGDTVQLDVIVDANYLVFDGFPSFSVDKQFPLQLRLIKTAED